MVNMNSRLISIGGFDNFPNIYTKNIEIFEK